MPNLFNDDVILPGKLCLASTGPGTVEGAAFRPIDTFPDVLRPALLAPEDASTARSKSSEALDRVGPGTSIPNLVRRVATEASPHPPGGSAASFRGGRPRM